MFWLLIMEVEGRVGVRDMRGHSPSVSAPGFEA